MRIAIHSTLILMIAVLLAGCSTQARAEVNTEGQPTIVPPTAGTRAGHSLLLEHMRAQRDPALCAQASAFPNPGSDVELYVSQLDATNDCFFTYARLTGSLDDCARIEDPPSQSLFARCIFELQHDAGLTTQAGCERILQRYPIPRPTSVPKPASSAVILAEDIAGACFAAAAQQSGNPAGCVKVFAGSSLDRTRCLARMAVASGKRNPHQIFLTTRPEIKESGTSLAITGAGYGLVDRGHTWFDAQSSHRVTPPFPFEIMISAAPSDLLDTCATLLKEALPEGQMIEIRGLGLVRYISVDERLAGSFTLDELTLCRRDTDWVTRK